MKPQALRLPLLAVLLSLPSLPLLAQDTLTVEEAIGIARANNYSIKLAKNDLATARNNNTAGNAGYLPSVDLTAGYSGSLNNSDQLLTSGENVVRNGAAANSFSSGVGVQWTVFDGFGMSARRDILREQQRLGEVSERLTVESTSADVIRAYYEIVRQQEVLRVITETMKLSQDRLANVQLKYEVGENSKREVLQARVDLNSDLSSQLRQEALVENAKTTLNQILARDEAIEFAVTDTIIIARDLEYEVLKREMLAENVELKSATVNRNLAELDLRAVKSEWYPRVGVNLGYNLLQSNPATGQIERNRNMGLSYGLSASFNIFDGFNTERRSENARIAIQSSELEYADLQNTLEASLLKAYRLYRNRLRVVDLERENVAIARENLNLALERYRVGVLIPLELREAQNNYVSAESRLVSAQYDAKLAETDLLRLSGRIGG